MRGGRLLLCKGNRMTGQPGEVVKTRWPYLFIANSKVKRCTVQRNSKVQTSNSQPAVLSHSSSLPPPAGFILLLSSCETEQRIKPKSKSGEQVQHRGKKQRHEQVLQREKTALALTVGRWVAGAVPVQKDDCSSIFVTPRSAQLRLRTPPCL